jgi:hypothetical protein
VVRVTRARAHALAAKLTTLRLRRESLEEWSAYGVAVPLLIDDGQQVAQYYAPSLSALQLFAAAPPSGPGEAAAVSPCLLFEFFERAPPFARKPLSDALTDLAAGGFPALGTLSSADLHARSFIAVCWQPISRIPLGRAFREISASFITYHRLATGAGGHRRASCLTAAARLSAHTPSARARQAPARTCRAARPPCATRYRSALRRTRRALQRCPRSGCLL